jgi:antitoxin HicB
LLRDLRALARKHRVLVSMESRRGKGSHITVRFGDRETVIPQRYRSSYGASSSGNSASRSKSMGAIAYPASFLPDDEAGGYVVVFPDVAGAATYGETREQAYEMAQDALGIMLESHVRDHGRLPARSETGPGQRLVELSALDSGKLALALEMAKAGISKTDLAIRLGVDEKEARRILAVGHNTKLDRIEAAFKAVGRKLTIQVEAA